MKKHSHTHVQTSKRATEKTRKVIKKIVVPIQLTPEQQQKAKTQKKIQKMK